jgi:hypothetical protein
VEGCPLDNHRRRATRNPALKNADRIDPNLGLLAGINGVEMRRLTMVELHANHDAKEAADFQHSPSSYHRVSLARLPNSDSGIPAFRIPGKRLLIAGELLDQGNGLGQSRPRFVPVPPLTIGHGNLQAVADIAIAIPFNEGGKFIAQGSDHLGDDSMLRQSAIAHRFVLPRRRWATFLRK